MKEGLRRRRHQPIPEQGTWLKRVVTGYFAYHSVSTNNRALGSQVPAPQVRADQLGLAQAD